MSKLINQIQKLYKKISGKKQSLNGTNTEDQDTEIKSLNSVITRETVEGTPFTIIQDEKEGWFLTIGDYRLTAPAKTRQAIKHYMNQHNNWELIGRMTIAYIDYYSKHKNN